MTPLEAVLVPLFISSPILPPIIGYICGSIYDRLAPPNPAAERFAAMAAERQARREEFARREWGHLPETRASQGSSPVEAA